MEKKVDQGRNLRSGIWTISWEYLFTRNSENRYSVEVDRIMEKFVESVILLNIKKFMLQYYRVGASCKLAEWLSGITYSD